MPRRRVIDAVFGDSATMSISAIRPSTTVKPRTVIGHAGSAATAPAAPLTIAGRTSETNHGERSVLLDHFGGGVDVGDKLTERVDAHSVSLASGWRAAVSASSQLQSLYKA
jgi:hypothetical protein